MSFSAQPTPAVFPWMPERSKPSYFGKPHRTPNVVGALPDGKNRYLYRKREWWLENKLPLRNEDDPKTQPARNKYNRFNKIEAAEDLLGAFQWIGMKQNENLPVGMRTYFSRPRLQTPQDRPKQIRKLGSWAWSYSKDWQLVKPATPLDPKRLAGELTWNKRHTAVALNDGIHPVERSYFSRMKDYDHGFSEPHTTLQTDEARYEIDLLKLAERQALAKAEEKRRKKEERLRLAILDRGRTDDLDEDEENEQVGKRKGEKHKSRMDEENSKSPKDGDHSPEEKSASKDGVGSGSDADPEELLRRESDGRQERLKKDFKMSQKERKKLEMLERDYKERQMRKHLEKLKVTFAKEERKWKPPALGVGGLSMAGSSRAALEAEIREGKRALKFMLEDDDEDDLERGAARGRKGPGAKSRAIEFRDDNRGRRSGSEGRKRKSGRLVSLIETRPDWQRNFSVRAKAKTSSLDAYLAELERPVISGVLGVSVDLAV
eukprot:CAMPEP_0179005982 /NCGR_PEP_ID=MMETSP0795-20121207/14276_1 /TAXON_ID=88552 /ORGANISM="Amoebophrya sp., Strain Ameob2" /LENGTH=489 /DNA_ID=CAMNT_0020700643 /DNA_START=130 /DNA_END=1599 /DNA_ORIENTATION=-